MRPVFATAKSWLCLLLVTTLTGCNVPTSADLDPAPGTTDRLGSQIPRGPAADAASMILEELDPGGRIDHADVSDWLSSGYELPERDVTETLRQVRASGPWEVVDASALSSGSALTLVLRSTSGRHMSMHVETGLNDRVEVLWFGHAVDRSTDLDDLDELRREIEAVPAQTSILAARSQEGRCSESQRISVSNVDGDELPLASAAKIFVVAAVMQAVQDGELAWSDHLQPDDSSATDSRHESPSGSALTVADAIVNVFETSDNTAADLLIREVGRSAVETAVDRISRRNVDATFLLTSEVFHLGWSGDRLHDWKSGSDEERSAMLEELSGQDVPRSTTNVDQPVWMYGLDWFATAEDLCNAVAWINSRISDLPSRVQEAMRSISELPGSRYDIVKTGGLPGVATLVASHTSDETGSSVLVAQFASSRITHVGDRDGLLALADALLHALINDL